MRTNGTRTLKRMIQGLEKRAAVRQAYHYLCVIDNLSGWDTPRERERGYLVQPYIRSAGGTGEDPFYLATVEELQDFRERDDVVLHLLLFGKLSDHELAVLGDIPARMVIDHTKDDQDRREATE